MKNINRFYGIIQPQLLISIINFKIGSFPFCLFLTHHMSIY